jgi:hypothetical protein
VSPAHPQTSGAIRFTDVTDIAGVALPGLTTESVAWGDYDNDGDEDLYLTNDGRNRLFRNDGEDRFTDVTSATGVGNPAFSVGAAFGDLDNDGDLDVIVTSGATATTRLWRNDSATGHRWLTLRLLGTNNNRSAIGARVEVQTPIRTTVQEVSGSAGRGNQNSLPLEFGLGAAERVVRVTVRWPSGLVQVIGDVAVDQRLTIVEEL